MASATPLTNSCFQALFQAWDDFKIRGDTYADYLEDKSKFLTGFHGNRYVPFASREDKCAINKEAFEPLSQGKYRTEWKGISMLKCCMDMVAYQQLMWEQKPATIIELGTAYGASALWMSDIMAAYGAPCQILTVDIDGSLCHERARKEAKNVQFLIGDCNAIADVFPPKMLESLPHPWLFIDDAHINVVGVLDHFHKFTKRGDYIIVEDTNPSGHQLVEGHTAPGYKGLGEKKLAQLKEFMEKHLEDYLVDSKIQDMFGYNGSWNMNSTLIRT